MSKATEPVVLVASSEFTLKSAAVRRTLEQRLIDDLKFALRRGGLECSRVEKDAARLVVFGTKQPDAAAALCSRVFGVAYAAAAQLLINPGIGDVIETVAELAQERLLPGRSFAVRAHRSAPGVISRRDVEVECGSRVLGALRHRGVTVDLGAPDVTFHVDFVGSDAYVYCEKLKGPGGLPPSAQWKMLAVLDCGALSILAACAMLRRGCVVELLIPVSDKVPRLSSGIQLALAEKVGRLVTRPNYKAFMLEIDGLSGGPLTGSSDWRGFVRAIAVRFARENRFRGLIFGDVSGHLSSLRSYSTSTREPIFYPLVGLEEEDLAELSRVAGIDESELSLQGESEYRPDECKGEMESHFEEPVLPPVREVHF